MSGVILPSGIRSSLLSLQSTVALEGMTETRLATGKKVNSPLDNPSTYFVALSLGSRAQDLGALLDGIGQAQNVLAAASNGINAISRLVQAAKSLALQAQQAPPPSVTYASIDVTGSASASETLGSVTGSTDTSGTFVASVDGLQIKVGSTTYTVHQPSAPTPENIHAIIKDINATPGLGTSGAVSASLDQSGKHIKLIANNTDTSFQVLTTAAANTLGVANQSGTSINLLQAISGLAGTSLTVQANGGVSKTITFGVGGAQVSTYAELQNALSGSNVSASMWGNNLVLTVDGSATRNSFTLSGSALTPFGLQGGTQYGAVNAPQPNPVRLALQAQYDAVLQQIDVLAADATYGGIGLLRGDSLSANLNETGSNTFTVSGVSFDSAGLGLAAASGNDFQSDTVLDSLTNALDAALSKLRMQGTQLGTGVSTLQTRQDFTKTIIETLKAGVANLTLADSNEESANMLALQTRQKLTLLAASLATSSDLGVLKMLR
jgi:flagellin